MGKEIISHCLFLHQEKPKNSGPALLKMDILD